MTLPGSEDSTSVDLASVEADKPVSAQILTCCFSEGSPPPHETLHDIPDISPLIHPTVAQVIKMCGDEGTRPKVADFEDRVEDSNFITWRQSGVARWSMDRRDTEGDRAELRPLEWRGPAGNKLGACVAQNPGPGGGGLEVALALDVFEPGGHFCTADSFDADASLNQVLATVSDRSPIMRDFSLSDLAATELKGIRSAVRAVFDHLW